MNTNDQNKFQRKIQSKTDEMIQKRGIDTQALEQIDKIKKGIDVEKNISDKDRYNDKDKEKKKQNPIQNIIDIFTGEWARKKAEEARIKKLTEQKNERFIAPDRYEGLTLQDVVSPKEMEIDFNHLQIGERYYKTFFVSKYPRFVGPNWLSPIVNFEYSINISTFYYPVDSKIILDKLKRKIGEMEATLYQQMEERKVIDPSIKVALSDAQQLQDAIAEGTEKYFHFAMYITISAVSPELLEKISRNVVSTLAAMNLTAKQATLQQEQGFISSQPLGLDKLYITQNMDTTSLATTFPFVTSELTMDHGIMYGINQHNNSLVVFDRFEMENANAVIFAKSGAGKSYFVKLEALRSLMLGTELIIIDPDKEYQPLCQAVNGAYISFSQDKGDKINPFELSGLGDPDDDELRMKLLSLQGFIKLLVGKLSPLEISILDRALLLTYREKGITLDPATQRNATPPLLEDLYKVLKGMSEPEARALAGRLERFIIGSAAGIFNERSTIKLDNPFMVFSVRDLQEELRPMAMYLMLDFIWTRVRQDIKRRILLVDEAWYMMQNDDSAKFMYSVAKRARKYYLGLSTITQDVDDFLQNDYGKAIINNSSIQFLMKQSPNAIDRLQQVFSLSEGEKSFLLSCDKGQGIFFAGSNHVAIQVVSSKSENRLITSDPKELEKIRNEMKTGQTAESVESLAQIFDPPAVVSPIKEGVDFSSKSLIKNAIAQRKRDAEEIMSERQAIENLPDTGDKINDDIARYNSNSTSGFLSEIVSNARKKSAATETHVTPQGYVGQEEVNNQTGREYNNNVDENNISANSQNPNNQ